MFSQRITPATTEVLHARAGPGSNIIALKGFEKCLPECNNKELFQLPDKFEIADDYLWFSCCICQKPAIAVLRKQQVVWS